MATRAAIFRPGDRPWLNLALLVATVGTTLFSYLMIFGRGGPGELREAAMFSLSLVGILGSHEMGHYLMARRHGVDTSLPYFIPLPVGFGTLGAVIRIRGPIPNRNALVDIGAAGPLAGLAVALPVLVVGLIYSTIGPSPVVPAGFPRDGSLWAVVPQLWQLVSQKLHGLPSVEVASSLRATWVFGDNLAMLGLQRLVFGPMPKGYDVFVHPLVISGWFGLLVTMLNLIPIGQLDGGHLTHALLGARAQALGKGMALLMFGLCLFFSAGWVVWLVVTAKLIGFRHPPVEAPAEPLSRGRVLLCALCAVGLLLCVMPVPLQQVALP